MHYQVFVPIEDASQVGEARRAAVQVANLAHLDDTALGKLAIVVTELATNIVKHAKRGEILIGNVRSDRSVDVIALDSGPGMDNLERFMEDGFSSAGTAGQGLGAISASEYLFRDLYTPRCGDSDYSDDRGHGLGDPAFRDWNCLPAGQGRNRVWRWMGLGALPQSMHVYAGRRTWTRYVGLCGCISSDESVRQSRRKRPYRGAGSGACGAATYSRCSRGGSRCEPRNRHPKVCRA